MGLKNLTWKTLPLAQLYKTVSEWVTGRLLREDKTHITGLTINNPDILVPKQPWQL